MTQYAQRDHTLYRWLAYLTAAIVFVGAVGLLYIEVIGA